MTSSFYSSPRVSYRCLIQIYVITSVLNCINALPICYIDFNGACNIVKCQFAFCCLQTLHVSKLFQSCPGSSLNHIDQSYKALTFKPLVCGWMWMDFQSFQKCSVACQNGFPGNKGIMGCL